MSNRHAQAVQSALGGAGICQRLGVCKRQAAWILIRRVKGSPEKRSVMCQLCAEDEVRYSSIDGNLPNKWTDIASCEGESTPWHRAIFISSGREFTLWTRDLKSIKTVIARGKAK